MPSGFTFKERTAENGDSLQSFMFSQEGGGASGLWGVDIPSPSGTTAATIEEAVKDIIGYTNPFTGTQQLQRTLPYTNPAFPQLTAFRIASIQGVGQKNARVVPARGTNIPGGARPISDFLCYGHYDFKVDFSTRNYPMLPDLFFAPKRGTYAPPPPSSSVTASTAPAQPATINFQYAPEWGRFCDWEYTPQNNSIQAQSGQFRFSRRGKKDGPVFNSPPWMYLPDLTLKIVLFQVPYRWITSSKSYIARPQWVGRINQNDWWNWRAGSLLYQGFNVKRFTPPFNDVEYYKDLTGSTYAAFAKLCDVELLFTFTGRKAFTSQEGPPDPYFTNWVAAGHNLQPFFGNVDGFTPGFHYVRGEDTGNPNQEWKWVPPWSSFPVEALFSDPDAAGGIPEGV